MELPPFPAGWLFQLWQWYSSQSNTFRYLSKSKKIILCFTIWSNSVIKKRKTTLIFKNIISFFSFSFIIWNVQMGRVRESRRQLRCTHTRVMIWFFCETSLPICFILSRSKSSLLYIIFQMLMQIPHTCCTWTHLLLACTHTIYMTLLFRKNLCLVYFRKIVHFLLCHICNICGISAVGQPASRLLQEIGTLPVMPPI